MSYPGNNYVVPGAINSYTVVSNNASTNTPLTVTATTQATAQTVISIVLSTNFTSNISVFANFTYRTISAPQHQMFFYIESVIGGITSVVGFVNTDTIQGNTHFSNCGLIGEIPNTSPDNITLRLKVYASLANDLIIQPAQLLAIGNIYQG